MVQYFYLNETQIEDFAVICDLEPAKLVAVVQGLQRLQPGLLAPQQLAVAVANLLGEGQDAAPSLVRQALSAHRWIRQMKASIDAVLEGIRANLQVEGEWEEAELAEWSKREAYFGEFLALPLVRLAARVMDVSYDYANLLRSSRILTDIRPIYDEEGSEIQGAVVSHTLRFQYDSLDASHEMNISVDETDLEDLLDQCSRALRKASAARRLMVEAAKVPTIINGGADNG